ARHHRARRATLDRHAARGRRRRDRRPGRAGRRRGAPALRIHPEGADRRRLGRRAQGQLIAGARGRPAQAPEGEQPMNNPDFMEALAAVAADKGISVDPLLGVLADALESAYKRMPGAQEYAWVILDPDSGDIRVMAQELDDEGEPMGEEFDVTPDDFG